VRLFAFLCSIAVASPALGQGGPVFAGAAGRAAVPTALADKIGGALAEKLQAEGVSIMAAGRATAASSPGSADELSRLLDDARGRYLEGAFSGAIKRSAEALERFEATAAYEADEAAWKTWSELMLVRALALNKSGKKKAANQALGALATARPDYVPDPGLAPPKFASLFTQIRDELSSGKVTISATSRPAGATVIIDGVERGVTPLEASDLLPGRHFVSLRLGEERYDEAVFVRSGSAEVRAELGDPRREAASQLLTAAGRGGSEQALVDAAAAVGDEVLLAVVEPDPGGFAILVGRVKGGSLVAVVGTSARDDLSDLDGVTTDLALASLDATADGWLGDGEASTARARFLGTGTGTDGGGGGEEGGGGIGTVLVIGAGVAVLAVAAAATVGGIYLFLNAPPNPGGIDVVVDASNL
jgi:hypothetical protein